MLIGALVAVSAVAATAFASQASDPAVTSRAQVEEIVRNYILNNPEILPEAMERLQNKRMGAVVEENRTQIETPYASGWEGNPQGDVVLVEFFDYACGYCRTARKDIAKLVAEDKNLKVVYRELPILSEESGMAARVSLLAAQRGKYVQFHTALYDAGRVTQENIFKAAAGVGIDRKAAEASFNDKQYNGELEQNIKLAQALGASGTPTFVVGDQVLAGAVGYDALKKAITAARAKK